MFNKHDQVDDDQLKNLMYQKITNKDDAKELLNALKAKDITFDNLWNDKLYSTVIFLILIIIMTNLFTNNDNFY